MQIAVSATKPTNGAVMSGGWNTIESDAGVFTFLVESLGVKDVEFSELVSLDEDSLSQLSPVYGVVFLFKYPTGEQQRQLQEQQQAAGGAALDGEYDEAGAENMFFAAQTIQNACGTQALLSILLNKEDEIDVGPQLREFKEFTTAFPADLRGEALSNSELIRSVHNSFSRSSPFADETKRLAAEEDEEVYHFIAYAPINGVLYELDGLQPAPISHGRCEPGGFPAAVVPVLRRRIARYPDAEIRFNLLAVVRDGRKRAEEAGDVHALQQERDRRDAWRWENALRRHNFVGFIGELTKAVVGQKVAEGGQAYENWLDDARSKTQERLKRGRSGSAAAADIA